VDTAGNKTTLSADWEDIGRLAWSPDGREIWFSASKGGTDHSLFAVTLTGRTRQLLTGPGSLGLQDVAADGRVVIAHGARRPSIVVRAPGAEQEAELGWMDYSWLVDLSEDGKQILFSEQGVAGGPGYATYLRGTDGSPAVRLGKGDAHSLSHDGRWVVASDLQTHTLILLPTGPGQIQTLPSHGITGYSWAGFFPGDRRLLFAGAEKGAGTRLYGQDLDGSPPRPLTPEGVAPRRNTVSPDGRWIAANAQGTLRLFPVDGGEPRSVPGGRANDGPIRWNADGSILYVRNGSWPVRVEALDVTRGTRTLLYELAPRDPVGATPPLEIRLTPDGKAYAFGYLRTLQSLYQVTGLR
jgi:eukaryotic-like serine/threonine-protein kinase